MYDHSFIRKNFFYLHVVVVQYLAVQFVFCLNSSTLAYSFKDLTNQSPPCTANYKILNVLPQELRQHCDFVYYILEVTELKFFLVVVGHILHCVQEAHRQGRGVRVPKL